MSEPFYGYDILRDEQQALVNRLLAKYKGREVTDELKKEIWDELQWQKHLGNITIPFKVVMRRDPTGKYPEFVEVILDTKV